MPVSFWLRIDIQARFQRTCLYMSGSYQSQCAVSDQPYDVFHVVAKITNREEYQNNGPDPGRQGR